MANAYVPRKENIRACQKMNRVTDLQVYRSLARSATCRLRWMKRVSLRQKQHLLGHLVGGLFFISTEIFVLLSDKVFQLCETVRWLFVKDTCIKGFEKSSIWQPESPCMTKPITARTLLFLIFFANITTCLRVLQKIINLSLPPFLAPFCDRHAENLLSPKVDRSYDARERHHTGLV